MSRPEPDREFAAEASEWFEVAAVEPGLWMVGEPGHVFSWLIEGSERTVLLDTGCGLADIAAAIDGVAPSPVEVVNSHVHYDHVGGNELFERAAMHELAPSRIEAGCSPELIAEHRGFGPAVEGGYARLLAVDRESEAFVLGPEQRVRPWPGSELERLGWRVAPPAPTDLLTDGDRIELGDRTLTVIHTPGHAVEHICMLDERAGILFAQDQAYYGPQLLHLDGSDIGDFARSTRRLSDEFATSVRSVYTAHCLRPTVLPSFLTELADAAEMVAADEAPLQPAGEVFGDALMADFGHFSLILPASSRAPTG
jgi:glyoxylase-like metal-dependent hydrolase (beta-lactamase superfamily II)